MIEHDEESLICDFAEYYHVLDYRELSPILAATLCFGLRDDSRVKLNISEQTVSLERMLLALITDRLGAIIWQNSGGEMDKPEPIFPKLLSRESQKQFKSFESPEDFKNQWNKIIGE